MTASEIAAPGVHAVRVPMHGGGLPCSLAYVVEDDRGGVLVVDPGSPGREAVRAVIAAVEAVGRRPSDVSGIVLTHMHADHAGGAAALREASGAPVLMHAREAEALAAIRRGLPAPDLEGWGVPAERRPELAAVAAAPAAPDLARPDDVLAEGDLLDVPGRRLRVLWTPGHTPGSLCLHDEDSGLVFTGDHVLPTVNPGLGLGGPTATNPIADYLASLERVAGLGGLALPGHEHPFSGLADRCAALAEHHLRRSREVAGHPGGTVWEVASTLTWTGGWSNLPPFPRLSALAQTALHLSHLAS
ncbi:MBL fold metallo-hydrolase [Leifsonia sp. C5G2]|uniref:MBL fold metallo-hydrolase n=1 Tax=Leifsonia sp. C5G2 TaxID=2735269 RepID=UPI001585CD42|nr:MBL fold metallo-hydrolase [Leifsonia sp. C5G2]NUU06899.1 MBL fold metallo-hydrolase [Leifsonia sp. C5G2]